MTVPIRPKDDNVLIILKPKPTVSRGGVHMVEMNRRARQTREALVVRVGPGYYGKPNYKFPAGPFHPTMLKAGQRILVDENAGQDYALDFTAPRHNKGAEFQKLCGRKGEFRFIREDEALAVLEEEPGDDEHAVISGVVVPSEQADTGDC